MKLTDAIFNLGRPVAYYPNLKKLTGSTTATILLCQLLYWTTKTKYNGWIYKTTEDFENETGLSRGEQRTAKKALLEAHLIKSEYRRLDHVTRFRVDTNAINAQWERIMQEEENEANDEVTEEKGLIKGEQLSLLELDTSTGEPTPKPEKKRTKAQLKADARKVIEAEIVKKVESRLNVIVSGARWKEFVTFAAKRKQDKDEDIDKFIDYLLGVKGGYDPMFVPPTKMKNIWPQGFIVVEEVENNNASDGNGIINLAKVDMEEEDVIEMPYEDEGGVVIL